ncbi:hypothetical protein Gotur_024158 [Gossypium turneri]
MVWLSSLKPWGMWIKQLLIYLIGSIRKLHQFQQFWQKLSGH